MTIPEPSGNPAFDAANLASLNQLAMDIGARSLPDNSAPAVLIFQGPGAPTRNVSIPAPQLSQGQLNAAEIRHKRRLIAAAIANGISPVPYLQALQAFGAPLYP